MLLATVNAGSGGVSGSLTIQTGTAGSGNSGLIAMSTGNSPNGQAGYVYALAGVTGSGAGADVVVTGNWKAREYIFSSFSSLKRVVFRPAGATSSASSAGGEVLITGGLGSNTAGGSGGAIAIAGGAAAGTTGTYRLYPLGIALD